MKKVWNIVALSLLTTAAISAQAADSVGACGLGSKLFEGQSGVLPQVLALTTNNTFGNQTFGITSGTLGCDPNGTVHSNWRVSMYIDQNRLALARDAAAGQGESLDGLIAVMGVQPQDQAHFTAVLKQEFAAVFANEQVGANLKSVLAADAALAGYARTI